MADKHFRISSALKNIIGKDLITDEFVAIFELVKNSFDANATRVDVEFENVLADSGRIVIRDNGKGMDLRDIEEKWLFVAYSAKKEGIEDYRDQIKTSRLHAGAKGIGRFSCDRLGKDLILYSRRNSDEKISKLKVNWADFEEDLHKKFDSISVSYEEVETCPYPIQTGTVLEISNARSTWDLEKLRTLRRSLEKLINPSQSNTNCDFSIYLKADEFKQSDDDAYSDGRDYNVINGEIKNFIFEKLDLKSTSIQVEIDTEGQEITTTLNDKGQFVYRTTEGNPYRTNDWCLKSIKVHLFALNKTSKSMFTKYMGVRPIQFGSVFVYKNGFRIHPIGEIGHGDVFGLDGRKQQGTSRYFGTRDLIGRIEIDGANEEFKEASSRDGGLERNEAFDYLKDFFTDHALKRLERFAIGVVRFGNIDDFDVHDLSAAFPQDKAFEFIEALTKSESIKEIDFNPDIFDVVSNASEKSLTSLLKNLSRIANDSGSHELDQEVEKIEQRLSEFSKATKDAESEAKEEKKRRKEAEKTAKAEAEKARVAEQEAQEARDETEVVTKQTMFLRSMVSTDLQNVVSLHHHIGIAAGTIENYARGVSKKIRAGKPMTAESFLSVLDEISLVARKISATTKFATKANFNLDAELIEDDLYSYLQEYVVNVCAGLFKLESDFSKSLALEWVGAENSEFTVRFRPLELAILMDGLLNNSVKAGAKKVQFNARVVNEELFITVSDDGSKPIKDSAKDKIFEMGFTTTKGSGLGLHHAKNILHEMHGDIELISSNSSGTSFELKFTRK